MSLLIEPNVGAVVMRPRAFLTRADAVLVNTVDDGSASAPLASGF